MGRTGEGVRKLGNRKHVIFFFYVPSSVTVHKGQTGELGRLLVGANF